MGIDATSSAVSSSSSSAQVSSASNSDNAKKTSSDSSFKDELDKVSSTETKDDKKTDKTDAKTDAKTSEKSDAKTDKVESKDTNDTSKTKKVASDKDNTDAVKLAGNVDFSQYGTLSVKDPNAMLADSNDIRQMINNTSQISALSDLNKAGSIFGYDGMNSNSISMNESDCPKIRELYKDFEMIAVERLNGINNKSGDRKNKMFKELLIANYPIKDLFM